MTRAGFTLVGRCSKEAGSTLEAGLACVRSHFVALFKFDFIILFPFE